MQARRSMGFLVSLALAVVAVGQVAAPTAAGGPTNETYPGTCPRNSTNDLQDCIDGAFPGSTITLTAEINDEGASIDKSLTLRATDSSLDPQLTYVTVADAGAGSGLQVTVQDIVVLYLVDVFLDEGSGHQVTLRRLVVGQGQSNPQGISAYTTVPASITVEGSFIRRATGGGGAALGIQANDPDGDVRFKVIGNRITQHGGVGTGEGIRLDMYGDGNVRTDIYNNRIWDVATCECGAAAGVAILPNGPVHGDVNIVGNTIVKSPTNAIQQRNSLTGSGRLGLDVFNNIFSHHTRGAVILTADPGLTFRAGYNDYFANGESYFDGESRGSGNRNVDPRFLDRAAGDLRLKSTSPLIDEGQVCSPGGVAIRDASGNTRLYGSTVDIGAYERGAGAVTGKALMGTSGGNTLEGTDGSDILCGYSGNDTLRGNGGRDYLDGGSDTDRVTGGSGPDRSYGGSGTDTICSRDGVSGNDRADGGSGSDKGRTDSGDTRVSIEASATC